MFFLVEIVDVEVLSVLETENVGFPAGVPGIKLPHGSPCGTDVCELSEMASFLPDGRVGVVEEASHGCFVTFWERFAGTDVLLVSLVLR